MATNGHWKRHLGFRLLPFSFSLFLVFEIAIVIIITITIAISILPETSVADAIEYDRQVL